MRRAKELFLTVVCVGGNPGGSNYHAMLDVVTDRCATAGLLLILSHLYPAYLLTFLYLLILDVSSHWYHMYSCKGHHKCISKDRTWLLRLYYGVYPFFGFCCIGTELFYILLYVLHFNPLYVIPGTNIPLQQVRCAEISLERRGGGSLLFSWLALLPRVLAGLRGQEHCKPLQACEWRERCRAGWCARREGRLRLWKVSDDLHQKEALTMRGQISRGNAHPFTA
jgi:phosphatidylglycerophosphate synthase